MKNIPQNKMKFQAFLVWMKYLFFSGAMPTKDVKPYVYVCPVSREREILKSAALRFELKKRGGITV